MTANLQDTQTTAQQAQAPTEKELNFRKLEKKMEEKDQQIAELQRLIMENQNKKTQAPVEEDDDEDDTDPYIDHKKFNKKLSAFEKKIDEKIEKKAEERARNMFKEAKMNDWYEQNADFGEVMGHIEKFVQEHPAVAKSILSMPDTFERQQLVYNTIKSFGVHKARPVEYTTQQKVDANRRSPYYQPSGFSPPPHNSINDGEAAWKQMQELTKRVSGRSF